MATNPYGRSRSVRAPQILTDLTGPGCSKVQSERPRHTLAAAPHAAAVVYAAEALPWSEWSRPDPKQCVSGGRGGTTKTALSTCCGAPLLEIGLESRLTWRAKRSDAVLGGTLKRLQGCAAGPTRR